MTFSFLYLALRALLGALVRSRRGLDVKDVELLVLRHELEILRRQVARPTLKPAARALLAAAACYLPRSSRGVMLVMPRTLLRWHQALRQRRGGKVRAGASSCAGRPRALSPATSSRLRGVPSPLLCAVRIAAANSEADSSFTSSFFTPSAGFAAQPLCQLACKLAAAAW